jgi:hypothetical protein
MVKRREVVAKRLGRHQLVNAGTAVTRLAAETEERPDAAGRPELRLSARRRMPGDLAIYRESVSQAQRRPADTTWALPVTTEDGTARVRPVLSRSLT